MSPKNQIAKKSSNGNQIQTNDISNYPQWAREYFANLEYSRNHPPPPPTKSAIRIAKWAKKIRVS